MVSKHRQTGDGVVHRLRRHVAFVEKIAAHYDEINRFADGVFTQNVNPGIEKITRRLVQLIARAAEMDIGDMEEFHSLIVNYFDAENIKRTVRE